MQRLAVVTGTVNNRSFFVCAAREGQSVYGSDNQYTIVYEIELEAQDDGVPQVSSGA